MQDFAKLLPLFMIVLTGCDALSARMRAKEGVEAYHAGRLDEAVEKFTVAAALAPNNPSIQIDLGFANLAAFEATPSNILAAQEAIHAFEHYLQLKPGEERARSYLVQMFVDANAYDAAVDYFRAEVQKMPPNGEALATLGNIAAKTGRFDEARQWYQQRIESDPDNADAHLALGTLIWDRLHTHHEISGGTRTQMADQGIATLKESIRLKPNSPNAYSYTTMLFAERALAAKDDAQKTKDLQQAQKFFSQANAHSAGPKKLAQKSKKK